MPTGTLIGVPHLSLSLTASAEEDPSLLSVTAFLYDFNMLYEIARLALDPQYSEFGFSDFVWYRQGRPLEDQDRLQVERMRLESPLELVTAVVLVVNGAITAVWGVVQIIEKISTARLNRRKLEAEVAKLEHGNLASKSLPIMQEEQEIRRLLRIREAERFYDRAAGRLQASAVRITTIDVEVISTQEGLRSDE